MSKPGRLALVFLSGLAVSVIGLSSGPKKPFDDSHLILQTMRNMGVQVTALRRMPDGGLLISGFDRRGQKGDARAPRPSSAVELRGRVISGKLNLNPDDLRRARLVSSPLTRFKKIPAAKLKPGIKVPGTKTVIIPDLRITDVIFTPSTPKRDEQVLMEVYIENRGDAPAAFPPDAPPLRVRVSGGATIEDIPFDTEAIAAHQQAAVLFYLPPFGADGTFTINADVDPLGRLDESNETNNAWTGALTVQGGLVPRINFKIERVWTRPSRITDYTYYWTIVARIRNEGPDATRWYDRITLAGFELPQGNLDSGDISLFDLAAGESYDFAQSYLNAYNSPAGSHQGTLIVDPLNQAVEIREDDNRLPFAFEIIPESNIEDKTDLEIESIRFVPENPTKDDDIGIEVRIRNAGPRPAVFEESGEVWNGISVEGPGRPQFFDCARSLLTIAPGETILRPYQSAGGRKLDPGIYRVRFEINPAHWVTETDYADNSQTVALTVRSRK